MLGARVQKMPLELRSSSSRATMQTKRSAWTPLNHPLINSKLFDERRQLLAKWFGSWSDSQRKAVLGDFVLRCSVEQLRFLSLTVSRRLPLQAADFTCLLPRALCLYLFSFLDPRSLCRCAQVSWHWRSIVELDQLWMAKCLRLGWCITFSPSAFEQGVWKRHYIETVLDLRRRLLQTPSMPLELGIPSAISGGRKEPPELVKKDKEHPVATMQPPESSSRSGLKTEKKAKALPPWRDSDRHPKDTIRFNYLDNLDPVEQTFREQMRSKTSTCHSGASQNRDGKRKTPSEATYKLRKAKSLMFLRAQDSSPPVPANRLPTDPRTQTRPLWASPAQDHPIPTETAMILLSMTQWNAGVRPGPVRTPVPQLSLEALKAARRSQRSTPSVRLFNV
ncbi:F-box only protein 16 isoform X1 [Gambusia affinis]|uniref:F-box only protein 16 isoform X1 n=2 Tax=Gambusia affinis TaxID=33528 RepID=UPI001CDD3771|nr:F-box only protein 16 isoform X1 [Gambusia affinis]